MKVNFLTNLKNDTETNGSTYAKKSSNELIRCAIAFNNVAFEKYDAKDFEAALSLFENVVEINAYDAIGKIDTSNLYNASLMAVQANDSEKAIELFDKLIDLDPSNGDYHLSLIQQYTKLENDDARFNAIKNGGVSDDPTVYINITSKKVLSDAPNGKENWFVMINTPHNSGQFTKEYMSIIRKKIIKKINRMLAIDVEKLIAFEEVVDPSVIEKETLSFSGALYGTSSNTKSAAFFRHPNFSKKIQGLYFCGGSVHPGGGIPLALSSAKIVDGLIN